MFEDFYHEFMAKVHAPSNTKSSATVLVSEKNMRQELERLFRAVTKSRDYLLAAYAKIRRLQHAYDDSLEQIGNRLTSLCRRHKPRKNKSRAQSQKRAESQNAKSKGVKTRDGDSKSPSQVREHSKTRKISERSKTPDFNSKAKQNTDKSTGSHRVTNKNNSGSYLANKIRTDSRTSSKIPKNYVSNSPIKAKPEHTPRISNNKKFPTNKSTSPMDRQNKKPKSDDIVMIVPPKDIRVQGQKESKSSLSNVGHRGSLYELKPKSTIEKIKVSKEGTIETSESYTAFKNSINQFRKHLTISHNSSGSLNNRKIVISSSSVIEEFMKKLDRRNTLSGFGTKGNDDSDIKEVNPLDL